MSGSVGKQDDEVSNGHPASMTEGTNILKPSEPLTASGEQYTFIEITHCKEIFTCNTCNVSGHGTRFSEHLMKHLLRHPYKCLHCSESFAERKHISAHMQTEHPGKEKKIALRANKRASIILDEAAKRGFYHFKSHIVELLQSKKQVNSEASLMLSESVNNQSSLCVMESLNSTMQHENQNVLKTKDQVLNKSNGMELNSPKSPHSDQTFSDSESKNYLHADDKNKTCVQTTHDSDDTHKREGYEEMSTLQIDDVNQSPKLETVAKIGETVSSSSSDTEKVKLVNTAESNVQLNARSTSCHVPDISRPLITNINKGSVDKTCISEPSEKHHVQCSFDGSLKIDHTGESSDVNISCSDNLNQKPVDVSKSGNIRATESFTKKPEVLNDHCEKPQNLVEKPKVPAQLKGVEASDDRINISTEGINICNSKDANNCKNNSVENAESDKTTLQNVAVGTINDDRLSTGTIHSSSSNSLAVEHKSTISKTLQLDQDTATLHNNAFPASNSLNAACNIQLQPVTSPVKPSQQMIAVVRPNMFQYVQNAQHNVNVSPVIYSGGISSVSNVPYTPVSPVRLITASETVTSYIVVPLTGPSLTLSPVVTVHQAVVPQTFPQNVATATESNSRSTPAKPNVKASQYQRRLKIKNNTLIPVSVQETSTILGKIPRYKKSKMCISKETIEDETQYVSEALEKSVDIVFEQADVMKNKSDILIAIVGNEYLCGKCRLKWKKKELFWFHLWNHQHIGGILCSKCVRINASTGELTCTWTDSFINLLEAKQQKFNHDKPQKMKYSIMKANCTSDLSAGDNSPTIPADDDGPGCSSKETEPSLLTKSPEHNELAEEADNTKEQANDNDATEIGLKILECKTLNIEEFEGISVNEENSEDKMETNSEEEKQEKSYLTEVKEKKTDQEEQGRNADQEINKNENLLYSDSTVSDNLEKILKSASNIDSLFSEVEKSTTSENVTDDESVTMNQFASDEAHNSGVENVSDIAVNSLNEKPSCSDIFSHVQAPAYHFYVCGAKCSFSCLLPGDFKQHLSACTDVNKDSFVCFHCRFVGETVDSLMRHMHKHAVCQKNTGVKPTNGLFVCGVPNCKFSTNILNAFYNHCCQIHHNLSSYACVSCGESYPTAEDLAQHLKDNLLSVVSCKHCMAKDINKNIVMEHILFEHPGKGKMLNTVKQLLCKDRKMYGYHVYHSVLKMVDVAVSKINAIKDNLTASDCSENNRSNVMGISQTSSEHQKENIPKHSLSDDSLCCSVCSFVTSDISKLKQHLVCHEHTPAEGCELQFICPACPMQVKTLKDLEDHAACHDENVSFWLYDCPQGDYQTNQVTQILQHVNKAGHSDENGIKLLLGNEKYITSKVIKCTCCKFKTASVTQLDDHMKRHSIITSKDPAVRVAAHSTTDIDVTSESGYKSHSKPQKRRVQLCSKEEEKSVKKSTKQSFSSVNNASKMSKPKPKCVVFTLPCESVFQTAVTCPQCSFSAHFKTNLLKHIKEKHPLVKVKESSEKECSVQSKSYKAVLSKDMKIGSSDLDKEMVTFYKTSGTLLICKMCGKKCYQKKFLHHHILDHLKLHLWKCNFCDLKDNRRFVITEHARHVHSKSHNCVAPVEDFLSRLSEHKCKISSRKCDVEVTVSDNLLCNAEMNEALKCFYKDEDWCLECILCKMKCSSIIPMHKHVLQDHLKFAMFGCSQCWFESLEECEILEHIHAKHSGKSATVLNLNFDIGAAVKSFINVCPASTKSLLLQHQSIKKKKLIIGNDDMDSFLNCLYEVNRRLKLVCLICKEEHSTKYASHRHLLAHLGVDLVGCSCCDFKALSDRDVTEHMKSSHAGIQLRIDHLDVDLAEAVKSFFERSCKTPNKESRLKDVIENRQAVKKSKATSSTSKLEKTWNGSSTINAHLGNKKDVTKIIIGGLTKFKCRLCDYLALSMRSVRAHILRSHPKTKDNLYKCSKCPFQVESLVEITSHMFQKHPWTSVNEFERSCPSPISKNKDSVHSTNSGVPSDIIDSVHSTSSCVDTEDNEIPAEVSSTKNNLNDLCTNDLPESLNKQTENCTEQEYVDVEYIEDDQVSSNKSNDRSSVLDCSDLIDRHGRHDKNMKRNLIHSEPKIHPKISMDKDIDEEHKHVDIVYSDISDEGSACSGEVVTQKSATVVGATGSQNNYNRRGENQRQKSSTSHSSDKDCNRSDQFSDISDDENTTLVVTKKRRNIVVGAAGDWNDYCKIGERLTQNTSTSDSTADHMKGSSGKDCSRSNEFSDISDDENTILVQTHDGEIASVETVSDMSSKDNVCYDQDMYSDISDDEMFDSLQECDKKRKIDLVGECVISKASSNKRHKQIKVADDTKYTHMKHGTVIQKVSAAVCDDYIPSKEKKDQIQVSCIDSNSTETLDPDVLDVGTKDKLNAVFQCSRCNFTTQYHVQSFAHHLKEAHKILKYVECNYCSARYTDTNTVKRHMNFFHKDRCKKYKLLPLNLLFKEVKHEVDTEELSIISKCENKISRKENEFSQLCNTESKKLDPNDIISSLKKQEDISPLIVDTVSSVVKDNEKQVSGNKNKNKSLSSHKSPVKQKNVSDCNPVVQKSAHMNKNKSKKLLTSSSHLLDVEAHTSSKESTNKHTYKKEQSVKQESNKTKKSVNNKTRDIIVEDNNTENDMDYKYKCKFCSYKENDTSKMKQHLFIHWHYKPYKCSFCLQGFVSSEKRAVHARQVHENIVTFCQLKKNKEIEAAVSKMLKVFERLANKDRKQKITDTLNRSNTSQKNGEYVAKENKNDQPTQPTEKKEHLKDSSGTDFKCFYCTKSVSSLEGLRIHFGVKHGDIRKPRRFWIDSKTGQMCNMSGAVFEDVNTTTYRQSFLCGYCSMRSSKRSNVMKHQRFEHSKKITFIVNLNNAQKISARVKVHPSSPLCKVAESSDEPAAKKKKLDKPSPIQKGEGVEPSAKASSSKESSRLQYCCNQCRHTEKSLYHYRRHLASHGTFRYLSADIAQASALRCGCCSYIASDEKDFSKHVECHVSGERPFKCGYCSYDSFNRWNVRSHHKSVHSGKVKIIDRTHSAKAVSFVAKTLVDIEPVVKLKDIMAVPAAEFGDLLLKYGVTTIDLSYVADDKMLQILKLFGSGIPEDQLYDLLNE